MRRAHLCITTFGSMMMKPDFTKFANFMLVTAACVIAFVLVRREFFAEKNVTATSAGAAPSYRKEWRELLNAKSAVSPNAPLQLVEFSDFECPFCKQFHEGALRHAKEVHGEKLAVTYIHFPLPMHRFAAPAARASICASEVGKFDQFSDALFSKQDSLGLKTWASYASEAGIDDTARIQNCAVNASPSSELSRAEGLTKKYQVTGTPTIVLNGWQFPAPPSDSVLLRTMDALLKGEKPF